MISNVTVITNTGRRTVRVVTAGTRPVTIAAALQANRAAKAK
jgi:hypothetical protein